MIEVAGPAHASVMGAIHAAAFPPREAWPEQAFAAQLALPGVAGLVHPEGGVLLLRLAADEAEILTLAVLPQARRGGLARGLLAAAMQRAAKAGAGAMFLEVSAANAAARALYGAAGFAEVGRRRAYYDDGSDALVLRADLSPGCLKRARDAATAG